MGSKPIQPKQPSKTNNTQVQPKQSSEKSVLVIFYGEFRVGKTSIKSRFYHGVLNLSFQAVVGGQYLNKTVYSTSREKVRMRISDTGGMERFRTMTPAYFRGAQIVMLVFDLTNHLSFVRIDYYIEQLNSIMGLQRILVCLVGSKCDLFEERKVFKEEGILKAKSLPHCFYHQTSALTGYGVDELFRRAVDQWLALTKTP